MNRPESYSARLGERLAAESRRLCTTWLGEIAPDLRVDPDDVLPEDPLLDHIPGLLTAIGASLAEPGRHVFSASVEVLENVRDLGELRHAQGLSLHQILREYEALWRILTRFVESETARLGLEPDFRETLRVLARLHQAVELLVRFSVDAYVERLVAGLEEQHQRLSGFNEAVSHEMRNPMHTLRMAVEVLDVDELRDLPPRQSRALNTIRNSVERMAETLARLQEVSDASGPDTTGESSFREREVELSAVFDEVRRWLADLAEHRSVDLRSPPLQPRATIPEGRLLTALLNVVANAILFSDPDKEERFVEITARTSEGDLVVEVRDNGVGIPEEDLPRVRAGTDPGPDGGEGPRARGTGLTLTRRCLDEMDGTLEIESEAGSGTTVVMVIPGAAQALAG